MGTVSVARDELVDIESLPRNGNGHKPVAEEPEEPFSIEAEEAVLGSVLLSPDALMRVADILQPEDFYREKHGWVFAAFLALQSKGLPASDTLLVAEELGDRLAEAGGFFWLNSLAERVVTSAHAEHYALIVEKTSVQRQLIDLFAELTEIAYKPCGDVDALIDDCQRRVLAVQRRGRRNAKTLKELCAAHYDRVEAINKRGMAPGLRTGFKDVDKLLRLDGYVIVGGRPSQGKSTFCHAIATDVAREQGGRVLMFSLEDSKERLTNRMVAAEAELDATALWDGKVTDQWSFPKYLEALDKLSKLEIVVDDTGSPTVGYIAATARREMMRGGLDLVIVDYLQLADLGEKGAGGRVVEVDRISKRLKALGRELGIPIIAVSPLSRKVEERSNKKPDLSDLRESGGLESDADTVVLVYRDDAYNENSERRNIVDVIVAKQKNGPTGTAALYFQKQYSKLRDAELRTVYLNGEAEEL